MKLKARPFDKYKYYLEAVQSPDVDVEFIRDSYKEIRKKYPVILREDFCGTFAICTEWVKLNKANQAIGVDLDSEPIQWGLEHHLSKLSDTQRHRLRVLQENVLNPGLPPADIVCAMNFSYYIFKDRSTLRAYFNNAYATLKNDGVLLVDAFGGSACQSANEESHNLGSFRYYWDQVSFDPVSYNAVFHIHFKRNGEAKRKKVFTYDWRMWTIPEIREIMIEAGFKKTHVYWEGTKRDGTGNGVFKRSEVGEECEAWIAYIVAEK